MKLNRYLIATPLLATGLLLSACGVTSSPSAGSSPKSTTSPNTVAHVIPAMVSGVRTATSVHVSGTVPDGSQQDTIDMSFVGNDVSGTVSQGTQSFTILLVSNKAYVKVDQAFLKDANLPSGDCSSMCGKWVSVPASQISQDTGSLSMSSITSGWLNSIPSSVKNDTTDTFTQATFNGQPVLQFTQAPYTIDLAATGTPYPLYIADAKHGSVTFSQWNAVPPLTAPPASEVITP